MVLLDASTGMKVRIVKIKGGKGLGNKCRQLGLCPGNYVQILRQAPFEGPLLIDVEGREVALGIGVAAKIFVEVIE